MNKRKIKLSKISLFHYIKLVARSLTFLCATAVYIACRVAGENAPFGNFKNLPIIFSLIWVAFMVEMLLRFLPSEVESMGCQKHFKRNFIPTEIKEPKQQSGWVPFAVFAAWIALNGVIGALYFLGVIDAGILLLISLAYSVCDMICILFFCPFQTWFMKNKCCGTCRIYNWDFAMMFTPLVFIVSAYTYTLLGTSLLLLLVWEIYVHKYPERFYEQTNDVLACKNCKEKLCQHKTQLRSFLKKNKFAGRR